MKEWLKALPMVFLVAAVTAMASDRETGLDFTLQAANREASFTLSESKTPYAALHFLLKTECPICHALTRTYFENADKHPDVTHIFIKPDETEEILKWAEFEPVDGETPVIYRDPDAKLAKKLNIPNGYRFHGEVVHYPALIIVDREGNEWFRYVGKSTRERLEFEEFEKQAERLTK